MKAFIARRMRRTLNVGLVGASVLAVATLIFASNAISRGFDQLWLARKESFRDIDEVLSARALAFEAKAQQSAWLFDRPQAPTYAEAYTKVVARLTGTYAGMLGDFTALDATIRQAEQEGDHKRAVALSIGNDPGEANHAFNRFETLSRAALDAMTAALASHVDAGLAAVKPLDRVALVATIVIGLLSLLGLRPRVREYVA